MFRYFADHTELVLQYLWTHAYLAVIPVLLGLVLALPLGWLASRFRWTYPPLISLAGLLYTIPSLVLFVLMPGILGTRILDVVNIVLALTVYAVALLVRVVADGLNSVPIEARQAATAMGFGAFGRLLKVEFPLAVPVIAAGVRVATVSNVSLVTVATLVGTQQLGSLIDRGFQLTVRPYDPILLGIMLTVLLALALDALILIATRLLTPWRRAVR